MQHQYALAHAHHGGSYYQPHAHTGYELPVKKMPSKVTEEEDGFMIMRDNKTPTKPMKLTQHTSYHEEEED
jgi:hypothetical protein